MNHESVAVPTIATVNRPAGIRAELALLYEIFLSSEKAAFQDAPHLPRGVVSGDDVHLVGRCCSAPIAVATCLLTGQTISAAEALGS
jgi:enoyl-CoA hydratase/carnithine racemase